MCRRDRAAEHRRIARPVGNHQADTRSDKQTKYKRVRWGEAERGKTKSDLLVGRRAKAVEGWTCRAPEVDSATKYPSTRAAEQQKLLHLGAITDTTNNTQNKQANRQVSVSRNGRVLDRSTTQGANKAKQISQSEIAKRRALELAERSRASESVEGRNWSGTGADEQRKVSERPSSGAPERSKTGVGAVDDQCGRGPGPSNAPSGRVLKWPSRRKT